MFLLDTDICIYLLNGRAPAVERKLRGLTSRQVATSAITVAELHYGALHSARPRKNLERIRLFLEPIQRIPFGDDAARAFGRIKQQFASTGALIGPMDLLIAATVASANATLVTNNRREFERVAGLRVADWD